MPENAMVVVLEPDAAPQCKRLMGGLIVAIAGMLLLGACSNDDSTARVAPQASTDNGNANTFNANAFNSNDAATLPANVALASPASPASTGLPAVAIQTPARPASSADPALSAAVSTPLAAPVIHTVD
jgi:hypothetical protein